ncbi:hypothetical protein [Halosolutus gelatinilyticus]|uniref:hypothetical protein n=1 Tax=Halosolutus gelatinilyticus TaxID=2931975 RepID=UPI001FF204CE|nr:hypothetical protein [Halosolutus gelatinilyticus]
MASHIEQTRLRAQVAALERELAASERRRQAIVDQYERVLDDRDRSIAETRASERRSDEGRRAIVRRLVATLR